MWRKTNSLIPISYLQRAAHFLCACVVEYIMQKHACCCISCTAHCEHWERSAASTFPDLMPETQDIIQSKMYPEPMGASWSEGIAVLVILSEMEIETSTQQLAQ